MTTARKILLSVLTAVLLTVLVPGAPASAHECYGQSCTGLDPAEYGCSWDARTITEFNYHYGANFQMRYSPSCNAVWTRTWAAEHRNTLWGQIRGYNCRDASCRWIIYGAQVLQGTNWTNMIGVRDYSPDYFKTCSSIWSHSGDPYICTDYQYFG